MAVDAVVIGHETEEMAADAVADDVQRPLRVLRITDPALRDRLAATVDEERMRSRPDRFAVEPSLVTRNEMTTDTSVTPPRDAGTTGRISLVGIGPGHTDHMTARARAAIAEADVGVGYVTYI